MAELGARKDPIYLPDAFVLLGLAVTASLGWMALLAMDNHIGTALVIWLLAGACLIAMVAISLAYRRRPAIQLDPWGLGLLAAVGAFAAFMFFPGFAYGATDKDPGTYVAIGAAFAHYHSYSFPDTLLRRFPGVVLQSPGARFPAVFIHSPGLIVPQFYHLWPALLAVANFIHGLRAEVQTTPLIGVAAVITFTALVRRLVGGKVGLAAGAAAGGWLAANSAEVWQAKYPTAEMLEQLLLLGILFCLLLARRTGWAPAAGLAGVLLGVDWLARADTILPVAILVVIFGALVALRRFDHRCAWFVAGFTVTLPQALWQAYGPQADYTLSNGVPPLWLVGAGTAAALVVALGLRYAAAPAMAGLDRAIRDRRFQRVAGRSLVVVGAVVLVAGAARTLTLRPVNGSTTWETVRWISWLVSWPGVALALVGFAVVALRPWQAGRWLAATLALTMAPVYIINLHNELPLMPGVRRLIPAVIPGLLLLAALAVAAGFSRRRLLPVGAALVAVGLFGFYLNQSLPLRHHNEDGGSFAITAQVAATAGPHRGVYLWEFPPQACCTSGEYLFGGALWLERHQYSALLPQVKAQIPRYVRHIQQVLPHHQVFVIWHGSTPPPLARRKVLPVRHILGHLQIWNESYVHRPTGESRGVSVDFTVWRVRST
ncbi:MAG: hypothetical protein ACYCO3_16580 [Mycobacteriales bacterium]